MSSSSINALSAPGQSLLYVVVFFVVGGTKYSLNIFLESRSGNYKLSLSDWESVCPKSLSEFIHAIWTFKIKAVISRFVLLASACDGGSRRLDVTFYLSYGFPSNVGVSFLLVSQ